MSNHHIICGFGRVGSAEQSLRPVLCVTGDAHEDRVLDSGTLIAFGTRDQLAALHKLTSS